MDEELVERVAIAIRQAGLEWKASNGGDAADWSDIPDEVFSRAAINEILGLAPATTSPSPQ